MTPTLTEARRAVWNCVEHWPGFNISGKNAFVRKYTFDAGYVIDRTAKATPADHIEGPTAAADCPAIAIYPASAVPKWWTNEGSRIPYTLQVSLWTAGLQLEQLEALTTEFYEAAYRHTEPGDSVPYLKKLTGFYPQLGNFEFQPAVLRRQDQSPGTGQRALMMTTQLVLTLRHQPKG